MALLPSAKTKCATERNEDKELESDDDTVATVLTVDSLTNSCNLNSVDVEDNIELHIDMEEDNIMTKDYFVSEIKSDHRDTNGRAHFDDGSQMTTTNRKDLFFWIQRL